MKSRNDHSSEIWTLCNNNNNWNAENSRNPLLSEQLIFFLAGLLSHMILQFWQESARFTK